MPRSRSLAGDFNVVRTVSPTSTETNDLSWPQNMGKLPGTHAVERDAHERLVGDPGWLENPKRRAQGFVDVWRLIYGEQRRQYTCVARSLSPALQRPARPSEC